jgi:glycerol-3-phosphate dehydrogenase
MGRALIGTAQSADRKQPGDLGVTPAEIDDLIAGANTAFPALRLTRDDVTLVHRGIVPAQAGKNGGVELLASPQILDHSGEGAAGAMSVIGVKYTTARAVGARAAAAAAKRLGRSTRRTDTDTAILPGAGISDHEALTIETARAVGLELSPPIIKHLNAIYGDRSAAIVRLMAERSDWRMPLVPGRPNVGAEVIHAIARDGVHARRHRHRRSELGSMGHRGKNSSPPARAIAAEELGWNSAEVTRQIAQVNEFYR